MKPKWLQVEMHNKMLKWMVAYAIKRFQRCPTDQQHEELAQPNVNCVRNIVYVRSRFLQFVNKPTMVRSLAKLI